MNEPRFQGDPLACSEEFWRVFRRYFRAGGYRCPVVVPPKGPSIHIFRTGARALYSCSHSPLTVEVAVRELDGIMGADAIGEGFRFQLEEGTRFALDYFRWAEPPPDLCIRFFISVGDTRRLVAVGCPETGTVVTSDICGTWSGSLFSARYLLPIVVNALQLPELPDPDQLTMDPDPISIGADIEFEMTLYADRYVPTPPPFRSYTRPIGRDGAGAQLEIRPYPAQSPDDLIRNIMVLFRELTVPVTARGDQVPIGAHIHFGLVPRLRGEASRAVVQLLDAFLGERVLGLSGAARGRYRNLGEYREQPWGFEYRVPPSVCFADPVLALVTLRIAYGVVSGFVRGTLRPGDPPTDAAYRSIGLSDQEIDLFRHRFTTLAHEASTETFINHRWTSMPILCDGPWTVYAMDRIVRPIRRKLRSLGITRLPKAIVLRAEDSKVPPRPTVWWVPERLAGPFDAEEPDPVQTDKAAIIGLSAHFWLPIGMAQHDKDGREELARLVAQYCVECLGV